MRAVIAEYERLLIRERLERGRFESAQAGNVFVGGKACYGYRLLREGENGNTTRTLEIVEEEARWIRQIFQWYVYGDGQSPPWSMRCIAKELSERRVPTVADLSKTHIVKSRRGVGEWAVSSVSRILTNTTYAGEWKFKNEKGELVVSVPPIIDRDLFDWAQRRREAATAESRRNTKREYLLRSRAFCQKCGRRMGSIANTARRKHYAHTYQYYRCTKTKATGESRSCDSTSSSLVTRMCIVHPF